MEKKPTSTMTSTYSVPSSLALQTQAFAYSDYNDDSMDDNSDSDLSISTRSWVPGHFMNGWPNPSSMPSHSLPTTHTMPAISSLNNNNNHRAKPRKSLSTGYRNRTDTKSKTKQKQTKKRDNATAMRLKRFQSTPSGLSTLAGNTMRHSESISTFLARQRLSDEDSDDEPLQEEGDEDDAVKDDDDDDDDDDSDEDAYTTRYNHRALNKTAKKSRNVDKACNHCKRSHLRCDNMRPCRRCVATGKTGCEDVDHKPRGRPRLQRPITT
ncbi:uncharacterized protein BYT42DRAFT_302672 [Radiomyces spectabilis]|uniref:uncharacterized protein n=1 Tax=Radiomyces spectabilis TaxID=64574 RepID=UPI00221EF6B4|nr:uncharacterized protein BYT42DRAFT_302672 [Radiomyces spectabilis]KAI8381360.1 hypothetical protein BYT42DRAFT_302672 [Radiomyces spectabilis]